MIPAPTPEEFVCLLERLALADEAESLRAHRDALLAVVRRVEWTWQFSASVRDREDNFRFCPCCEGVHPDDGASGHKEDCVLAAALALAGGDPGPAEEQDDPSHPDASERTRALIDDLNADAPAGKVLHGALQAALIAQGNGIAAAAKAAEPHP